SRFSIRTGPSAGAVAGGDVIRLPADARWSCIGKLDQDLRQDSCARGQVGGLCILLFVMADTPFTRYENHPGRAGPCQVLSIMPSTGGHMQVGQTEPLGDRPDRVR